MTDKKLKPMPGYALIKLEDEYESGLSTEREKYASNSKGVFISATYSEMSEGVVEYIDQYQNCTVYFTPFEDGDIVRHNNEEYVFVPLKQLRGGKLYV